MQCWKMMTVGLALGMAWVSGAQAADEASSVYRQYPISYMRASLGMTTMDFGSGSKTVDMPVISVGMGGMVNSHFGVEVRLARSLGRTDQSGRRYNLDHAASALFTVRAPLWRFLYGQAFVGVTDAQIMTISASGKKNHSDETTLSYGVEAGIHVEPHWRMAAGYTHYIDKSYWKMSAIEGTLQYLF